MRRRQLRLLRTVVVLVFLLLLLVKPSLVFDAARSVGSWLVSPLHSRTQGKTTAPDATRGGESPGTSNGPGRSGQPTVPFARVLGLVLRVPVGHQKAIAYHEAALPAALGLHPLGTCGRNANKYKFTCPSPTPGPRYIVMSSRGRVHPATSAVDVAMSARSAVLSPVSGLVYRVKRYFLYGRYLDYRISIIPEGHPGMAVVLIHVAHVRVHHGSRVTGGVTPLGVPRRFPFHSQVNDYVGAGVSHVHLEVKRIGH
ncbi:MAG TPA: hypothetical protein VF660_10960 [Actinomycetota bacterium]